MMRSHRLVTAIGLAIGIAGGLVLTGSLAEAQIRWFGFSNLCFEGTFKGGPVKDGELSITLTDFTIQTRCLNVNSGEGSCQPGVGNAGDLTVVVPAQSADPTKEKGIITAEGCIPLDTWDNHLSDNHQHTCQPLTNTNKEEVTGSGHVTEINTEWVLTNTNAAGVTQVLKRGFQTCVWTGSFDSTTCEPDHETEFVCPIDEIFKK